MKHNRTLRRGLGVLLALVMCLSLLPATALAAGTEPATETADFTTNATAALALLGGTEKAEWDSDTSTLTLNGVNFSTTAATAVKLPDGATVVKIDDTNFPDANFRAFVSDFDTNKDGTLSAEEIAQVQQMDCSNKNIANLKGIEHFTGLMILSCSQNQLKELDVSKNTGLYGLNCSENQLKALDVSKNAELVVLTCSKNQLETLSVSGNAKLNSLNCSENQLEALVVSGNTALETLECSGNMLTTLVVSNNTALKVLRCAKNQLTTLNVAKNSILNTLDCSGNQLTALSVSSNAELSSLDCSENQLEALDVSSNTSLDQLRCSNNRLKVLDVSKNTGLRLLYCKENQLTSLDLSENGKITGCYAENNSYEIELTSGKTFDLSTLPGKFEVGDASGWSGGTAEGNTLTVNDGATEVTYTYDCGNSKTAKFTLTVKSGGGVANEVAIDEANFPDEKFRQHVRVYTDKDGNGALSTDEIAQAEKIYCSNRGIKDFTGIEHFTALTELYCDKNQLIALDVSSNTALEYLECSESQLTTLNIGSNTKLKSLICSKNQLTSLDVSGNTALKDLVCSENRLATPNLSINPALENLDCSGNQLTTLGFSDGAALEKLICSDNRLATLNVSGSAMLTELHCGQNKLASLDVSKNTALEKLGCSGNQLTTLVVSSNTALTGLDCSKNNLTSLNLAGTQVNILYADDNTYPIKLTSGRTFDLTDLPGKFEVEKVSGWNGGSVSGNILTVNADATEVAYTYDCGKNQTATFTLTVQGGSGQDEAVKIDETNFPDANFRAFVSDFDTNKDEKLSIAEIAVVTKIDCDDKGIANLKGIEHFTALQTLICSGNKLTSLDLKSNAALTFLNCDNNRLAELDVSKNTKLTDLFCDGNQLIVLDVSLNTALKNLFCQKNQLTSLDLANTSIGYLLYANDNSYEITPENGTFDLSTLPGKFDIGKASGWNGGTVDGKTLTVDPKVVRVTYQYDCGKASPVTFTLKVKGGGGQGEGIEINEANFPDSFFRRYVEKLDTNNDGALNKAEIAKVTEIDVYGNAVEDLTGIEHFTALEVLDCGGNMLTKLDVSKNTALTDLDCSGNQLADLDVSKNTELKSLACFGNELTVLDLSTNTELTNLSCYSNKLTSLDLSSTKVTDANELYADDNTYPIKLTSGRTFDLSSLPGKFEVGNAGGWNGGSVSGNILTVNADATEVTYTYDCGHNNTETFTLTVQGGGEHTHSYGSDWKSDADKHWKECSCGDPSEEAAHTASDWITDTAATATTDGTKHKECTVCRYVMETGTIPATGGGEHTHSYGSEWKSNADNHWHECSCGAKSEEAAHTASDWITDTAATATTDGTKHKECTVCGYVMETGTIPATGGSSSSSSSGGGSSTPTYTPTVTQPENGTVTVSPKAPKNGDTVTITPKPEDGYTVEQILVTDKNGDPVKVTNNGDGTFSFTQPAGKVNVEVTFMEDNSMLNFFVDVPAGAYYYDAVLWAAEKGITGGVDDTHFAPNAPCTRAQIVTFLWRAAGCPEPESVSSFADVPADSYYAKAVAWAVENGITAGTGDGMFSPNATCTRAQAMTFIWRSQKSVAAAGVNPFTDVAVDAYYAGAVQWAVENGVTNGTSDTTFSPNTNCTRAQIVTFLYRCLGEE